MLDDIDRRARGNETGEIDRDLRALSALGFADAEVVGRLVAAIEPANDALRQRILRTLGDVAPALDEAGAAALARWGDAEARGATWGRDLMRMGKHCLAPTELARVRTRLALRAVVGLEPLLELLAREDIDAAELAAERLAGFGAAAQSAVPHLVALSRLPWSVAFYYTNARPTVGDLARARSDAPLAAALAIVAIAPRSAQALAAHRLVLREGDDDQRLRSIIALREYTAAPASVIALVRTQLEPGQNRWLRREALVTLSAMGPAAGAAMPLVEAVAAGDDAELAAVARSVLRTLRER